MLRYYRCTTGGVLFDIKIVSPRDVAYASGVPCWASRPNISAYPRSAEPTNDSAANNQEASTRSEPSAMRSDKVSLHALPRWNRPPAL